MSKRSITWSEFLLYIQSREFAIFCGVDYIVPDYHNGLISPDTMLDVLASDSVIVASDDGYVLLLKHRFRTGEPIMKVYDDGILRYHTNVVLRSNKPIRIQSCCMSASCTNYSNEDIIVCEPDDLSIMGLWDSEYGDYLVKDRHK